MKENNRLESKALIICDKLCLNYDLYKEFIKEPLTLINRYVNKEEEKPIILNLVNEKINKAKLNSKWKNAIACACRDIAYQIPD